MQFPYLLFAWGSMQFASSQTQECIHIIALLCSEQMVACTVSLAWLITSKRCTSCLTLFSSPDLGICPLLYTSTRGLALYFIPDLGIYPLL